MNMLKHFCHWLSYGSSKTLTVSDRLVISRIRSQLTHEQNEILEKQLSGLTFVQRWKKGHGEVVTVSPGPEINFDEASLPKFEIKSNIHLLAELRHKSEAKKPCIQVYLSRGLLRSIEFHKTVDDKIILEGILSLYTGYEPGT